MANYGAGIYATSTYAVAAVPAKATYGVSKYEAADSTYVRLDPLFTAISRFGLTAYASEFATPYVALSSMSSESDFYASGWRTNEGSQVILSSISEAAVQTSIPVFNNYLVTKSKFVTADDPLSINAVSTFNSSYTIDIIIDTIRLSSITEFKAEQLIEAATMSTNFKIIAAAIGYLSTQDTLNTQPSISFEDSASSITELSESGLMLGRQSKISYDKSISDLATRVFPAEKGASTALYIDGSGFRVVSSKAPSTSTDSVLLSDVFRFDSNKVTLTGSMLSRVMFQPLETPVLVSNINKNITGLQELVISTDREASFVELSIRIGTTSKNAMDVLVYGSQENFGYRLYVPVMATQPSTERFVTRRVRVPIDRQGKQLRVKLSAACSTAEIRVVGTWS